MFFYARESRGLLVDQEWCCGSEIRVWFVSYCFIILDILGFIIMLLFHITRWLLISLFWILHPHGSYIWKIVMVEKDSVLTKLALFIFEGRLPINIVPSLITQYRTTWQLQTLLLHHWRKGLPCLVLNNHVSFPVDDRSLHSLISKSFWLLLNKESGFF